ncbi:hypothetical protein [Acuticoccus mangrovi]|uniref:hypothetical protein n=1 Tax=Acuticoccus mangrovi TaxID=2796142 RepID=UPI0018EA17C9|nr:hypothetical protein [Acuticoccus mangrovi]
MGLGSPAETPAVISYAPTETPVAFSLPDGFLDSVGDGPKAAIAVAERDALQARSSGVTFSWSYKDLSGRVIPGPVYMVNARACRDMVHEAQQNGETKRARATLCLSENGTWERVG